MGWFWTSSSAQAPHPIPPPNAQPPPSCPMHNAGTPPQSCPVRTPSQAEHFSSRSTLSKLNPLNYMPSLSQDRAPNQKSFLSTSREPSTIPRGDMDTNWEYPSPQQMYNALLRKGFDDTPADSMESMVAVHNFLNEGAWQQILGWERRFAGGLTQGYYNCIEGEENFEERAARHDAVFGFPDLQSAPKLSRFMGRPNDKTPKVQVLEALGWMFPKRFSPELPFDRHDWFVNRRLPDGSNREVRYVIDYYSAPPEPTGEPVFYLDVRPAIDTPTAAAERMLRWGGDVWYKASGAVARQEAQEAQQAAKK